MQNSICRDGRAEMQAKRDFLHWRNCYTDDHVGLKASVCWAHRMSKRFINRRSLQLTGRCISLPVECFAAFRESNTVLSSSSVCTELTDGRWQCCAIEIDCFSLQPAEQVGHKPNSIHDTLLLRKDNGSPDIALSIITFLTEDGMTERSSPLRSSKLAYAERLLLNVIYAS